MNERSCCSTSSLAFGDNLLLEYFCNHTNQHYVTFSHIFSHLIFVIILWGRFYYPHFKDEETDSKGLYEFPRSHTKGQVQGPEPIFWAQSPCPFAHVPLNQPRRRNPGGSYGPRPGRQALLGLTYPGDRLNMSWGNLNHLLNKIWHLVFIKLNSSHPE